MNNEWEKKLEEVAEYIGGEPADGFLTTSDIVKELKSLLDAQREEIRKEVERRLNETLVTSYHVDRYEAGNRIFREGADFAMTIINDVLTTQSDKTEEV